MKELPSITTRLPRASTAMRLASSMERSGTMFLSVPPGILRISRGLRKNTIVYDTADTWHVTDTHSDPVARKRASYLSGSPLLSTTDFEAASTLVTSVSSSTSMSNDCREKHTSFTSLLKFPVKSIENFTQNLDFLKSHILHATIFTL